jgi:hypothetical protein
VSRAGRDARLLGTLLLAQQVRFAAAVVGERVTQALYPDEITDAEGYHRAGVLLARDLRVGRLTPGFRLQPGTMVLRLATGVVYAVTGPSKLRGSLAFSWLGFWGVFLFHRAFAVGVKGGNRRDYARLVFFMPSLVYWPSAIGKEPWMLFSLGAAARGSAGLAAGGGRRALAAAAVGTGLAAVVRPQVAGLAATAAAGSQLVARPRGAAGRAPAVVGALAVAACSVAAARRFFRDAKAPLEGGLVSVLRHAARRTGEGRSTFVPPIVDSPLRLPAAAMTVLLRPAIVEARNPQTLAAGLETSLLTYLLVKRRGEIAAAVRRSRDEPYIAFCALYTILFVISHSGIANFGILVRQRTQLLPMVFVLLSARHGRRRP